MKVLTWRVKPLILAFLIVAVITPAVETVIAGTGCGQNCNYNCWEGTEFWSDMGNHEKWASTVARSACSAVPSGDRMDSTDYNISYDVYSDATKNCTGATFTTNGTVSGSKTSSGSLDMPTSCVDDS